MPVHYMVRGRLPIQVTRHHRLSTCPTKMKKTRLTQTSTSPYPKVRYRQPATSHQVLLSLLRRGNQKRKRKGPCPETNV